MIKALTSFGTIKDNERTSAEIDADFQDFKRSINSEIVSILGTNTDINLEYRSKFNGHGFKFHDRYIMLIFDVNRTRVWSLGASVNQIGNTHHTIQIVNNPDVIEDTIRSLWNETNHEECILFRS